MFKYLTNRSIEYIFIILTATIIFFVLCAKSFSESNIFVIENIKVKGKIEVNFTRDRFISEAILKSFSKLTSQVLLSKDLNKLKNIKLNKIRELVDSFQIIDESYNKNLYEGTFKFFYNERKVKKFLAYKNVSFTQPKSISTVLYPIFFINGEMISFSKNYFYKNWESIKINNHLINYIIPLEDLDELSQIRKMKNNIDTLDVSKLASKYNTKNYAFLLLDYSKPKLNIYIKTNFDQNKISKNVYYTINNIEDKNKLNFTIEDLKLKIVDIWKESNIVNLLLPLSINFKFYHKSLSSLNDVKESLHKINIIDKFSLEEFSIKESNFKIYYYGNPKNLQKELFKLGYQLKNDKGYWELYLNE
tara:strand:+ start:82 stop:1164 length:1083 start_codon:yes stop_codon:yes gene_type:complete